jgi:hypothetical protein
MLETFPSFMLFLDGERAAIGGRFAPTFGLDYIIMSFFFLETNFYYSEGIPGYPDDVVVYYKATYFGGSYLT